jgi:PAS domain S-box-containing protein
LYGYLFVATPIRNINIFAKLLEHTGLAQRLIYLAVLILALVGVPGKTSAHIAESGTSGMPVRQSVIASSSKFPPVNRFDEHGEPTDFTLDLSSAVAKVGYTQSEVIQIAAIAIGTSLVLGLIVGLLVHNRRLRRTEASLQQLNCTLTTLIESRHALLRCADENELLNTLCHVLVDTGGYRFAWVGMAEHDTDKTVRPVAFAGQGEEYLSNIHISWADNKHGRGPAGNAIRTGISHVSNDIVNDPAFEPWREKALKHVYASAIALPLNIGHEIVGTLNIYAGQPHAFYSEVIQLLEELADDLSFGIAALRTRQERDFAQNALASAIHQRALILESIPDIVYQLDMGSRLVTWNKRLAEVTGYTKEELTGMRALEFFPAGEHQKILNATSQIMEAGHAELEASLLVKSGARIPYQISGTLLKNASGEVIGITGIGHDLSERIKVEAETAQLQRQLQQAQKMEAIGQLTGGIAHDFNNFLASIMGFTGLAQEKSSIYNNEKLQEYLRQVMLASERARDMVAQMLAFSRGCDPKLNPRDLHPLIEDSVKMLRYTLPSSVELRKKIQPDIPQVMVDPVQLSQAIVNLCINSRDAMNSKGTIEVGLQLTKNIDIECTSCHELMTGNYVELFVSDTGQGIDSRYLTRIFEPFFSTKDTGKGTGMGLAMVHNIVHLHKGHLHVDSNPNAGTTVRLFFPQASDQEKERPKIEKKNTVKLVPNRQAKILILDDEAPLALLEGELLKDQGYAVSIFTDSQEAIKHFEARPEMFDLVLTDYTMPGLTGIDIAQRMLEIRHKLPIILCTGYSEDVSEEWITAIGIKGYFRKPIDHQDLFKTVHKLLAHPLS